MDGPYGRHPSPPGSSSNKNNQEHFCELFWCARTNFESNILWINFILVCLKTMPGMLGKICLVQYCTAISIVQWGCIVGWANQTESQKNNPRYSNISTNTSQLNWANLHTERWGRDAALGTNKLCREQQETNKTQMKLRHTGTRRVGIELATSTSRHLMIGACDFGNGRDTTCAFLCGRLFFWTDGFDFFLKDSVLVAEVWQNINVDDEED